MNKKVKELVERVAKRLQDRDADAGECNTSWGDSPKHTRDYYRESARIVLNDPNLALIDREGDLSDDVDIRIKDILERYALRPNFANDLIVGELRSIVIPLAEALKEDE